MAKEKKAEKQAKKKLAREEVKQVLRLLGVYVQARACRSCVFSPQAPASVLKKELKGALAAEKKREAQLNKKGMDGKAPPGAAPKDKKAGAAAGKDAPAAKKGKKGRAKGKATPCKRKRPLKLNVITKIDVVGLPGGMLAPEKPTLGGAVRAPSCTVSLALISAMCAGRCR